MKKLLILMVSCILTMNLAGCTSAQAPATTNQPIQTQSAAVTESAQPSADAQAISDTTFIGEEKAEEIALKKAGLFADEVTFINIDLDRDDGVWKYELEFKHGKTEYEADINAVNGLIIKWEMDTD